MFEVTCPCGKTIPVRAGQAGGTVSCSCGQTVPVPLLSDLRRTAEAAGRATVLPPAKHDWQLWWRGVGLVIAGYTSQLAGLLLTIGDPSTTSGLAAVLFLVGYVLALVGVFAVGLGKGFALWFCLLLYFCIPLGGLVILFFPGKGADETP